MVITCDVVGVSNSAMRLTDKSLLVLQGAPQGLQLFQKQRHPQKGLLQVFEEVLELPHNHETEQAIQCTQPKDVHCFLEGGGRWMEGEGR